MQVSSADSAAVYPETDSRDKEVSTEDIGTLAEEIRALIRDWEDFPARSDGDGQNCFAVWRIWSQGAVWPDRQNRNSASRRSFTAIPPSVG